LDDSLAEEKVHTFNTRTLAVTKWAPVRLETLTPTIVVEFDQLVEPAEVLKVIRISTKKMLGKEYIFIRYLPDY
jgi:hypothetical protein